VFPTAAARRTPFVRLVLALACVALGGALAMGGEDPPKPPPPQPKPSPFPPPETSEAPRSDRAKMWPAPTAEDWKKPCLITWQRTWADAVAVAKETGKPILICINMDGEVASEHFAGIRYRQPEIAKLYEQYVTVIASVYRHNPRDYDDQGRRIPCPRFGGVTCGEHIAIEPIIYEKFCQGKRIAPRHIMVELDANGEPTSETFDVYYRNDIATIFQALRDGISLRTGTPKVIVRGDRPIVERVASREATDRDAVESAYKEGDAATKKALMDAALAHPDAAPLDLLRLGVFGLDPDMSKEARSALTQVKEPQATDLVAEALRIPMDAPERDGSPSCTPGSRGSPRSSIRRAGRRARPAGPTPPPSRSRRARTSTRTSRRRPRRPWRAPTTRRRASRRPRRRSSSRSGPRSRSSRRDRSTG
jgi:hypothetical protein